MSDSFADLWNSTAPSKSTSTPQKLGSLASNTTTTNINTNGPRRPQYDAFSMLSSAGTSTSSSRSGTPGGAGSTGGRTSQPPQSKLGSQSLRSPSASSASSSRPVLGGADAFSDLLGSTVKSPNDNTNMTIAERAKLAEMQRLGQQHQAKNVVDGAWEGLDSLMIGAGRLKLKDPAKVDENNGSDWDFEFGSLSSAAPAKSVVTAASLDDDDWGLSSEFTSARNDAIFRAHSKHNESQPEPLSKPKAPQSQPQSSSLWNLEDFTSNSVSPIPNSSTALTLDDDLGFGRIPSSKSRSRSDSPSNDFDFGNREEGLFEDMEYERDILGELSKPVGERRNAQSRHPQPQEPKDQRSGSPPPHIVGQLVEMGFSIQQAKVALASTDSGVDVEAALEVLIANGAADNERSTVKQVGSRENMTRGQSKQDSDHRKVRHPEQEQNRDNGQRRQGEGTPEVNFQEQADKLREIGMNMFSKASLFWKEGKERVQKVVEERVGPIGDVGKGRSGTPNRPRWMQGEADDESAGQAGELGTFRDDEEEYIKGTERPVKQEQDRRQTGSQQEQQPATSARSKIVDIFGVAEEPAVYKSRFRHKAPQTSASPSQPAPVVVATPPRPPTPLKQRVITPCLPTALSQSETHKSRGAEKFKLGQYAAAEESYTSAIACLPSNHLVLIPLYNNRALVRMKNGNYTGAAEDASTVVAIIGEDYHPAREARIEGRKEDGAGVDLGDGFSKALKRRAEAWEGRERWHEAGKDWERLAGMEWVKQSFKAEAVRGAGRCRRMVEATNKLPTPAAPKPKPKPRPTQRPIPQSQGPSKAVSVLRESTSAAEAEDAERHQLKDSVDTRLQAWKGGKETNLRALLSSLDTILWPELGLQKISLAELMSAGQVKKWYMKAIAKVHPDKLNSGNSTLEQRMLAGGVFAALNEAWNAFKP